ncbi:MAG: redoxin domain-containing protein [Acidobacteria bacterium]|nr:redoxin domain-containing protein [Acidobacteriota bacterium]
MKTVSFLILGAAFCQAQDAMEILHRAEDTYRGLRSLEVDVTYKFEMRTGSATTRDTRLDMHWEYRAPGHFRRRGFPVGRDAYVMDGTNLYMSNSSRREYILKPLGLGEKEHPGDFWGFWLANDAASATTAREESHDGAACWVITGKFKPRGPGAPSREFTAWIEKERYAIHQVVTDQKHSEEIHAFETHAYRNIRFNQPIDDSVFTIAPPPGFDKVLEFSRGEPHPLLGKSVPPLPGLETIKGRNALVFFWSPACCNDQLAFFDLLARQFGGSKFVVIGVTGYDLNTAQAYLKEHGLKLETISQFNSSLRTALQLSTTPSVALIAADGTLAYGGYAGTPDELRGRLAKLGVWP